MNSKQTIQHPADRILRVIADADDWMQDTEILKKTHLSKAEMDKGILELQRYRPGWVRIRKGLDETNLRIRLIADDEGETDNFFLNGGFTKMLPEMKKAKRYDDEMQDMQKRDLRNTTVAAEVSLKRANRAELIALGALIVSIATVILNAIF